MEVKDRNQIESFSLRISSNFFWLFVSEVVSKGLIFIGTLYLARVLGPGGFGLYSLSLSVAIYLWFVADLGISLYGAREVAKDRARVQEFFQLLNSMRIFTALALFLMLAIIIFFIPISLVTKKVIIAGSLYVIAYAFSSDWLLCGIERIQYIVLGKMLLACTFLFGIFFFVHHPHDVVMAAFFYSIAHFCGSATLLVVLKKKLNINFKPTFSWSLWKNHLKESWHFIALSTLGYIIAPLIIILLGVLRTSESIGFFSAPHRIIMLILGFMGIFSLSFYPVLADYYVHLPKTFLRIQDIFQKVMITLGLPIGIAGFILSKDIIYFLLGSEYETSIGIFNILIWLVPLNFIRVSYSCTLLATGFQSLYLMSLGISFVAGIALCVPLISIWGIIGASIALLFQNCILLILVVWMFQKNFRPLSFLDSFFIKALGINIVMGMAVYCIKINIFGKIALGIVLYCFLVFFIKLITREQLVRVYISLKNK